MTDALTITDLYPDLYKRMDVVSREQVGLLRAVSIDANMERAAKDQPIRTFVTAAQAAADFAPGQLAPTVADRTVGNKYVTIAKERVVNIVLDGNNQKRLNSSYGYREWLLDEVEQGLRTLVNEVESDLASQHVKASRLVAPAGTTLFDAANYKDIANIVKELNKNGAPQNDRSLVLSNAAAAAFRGLGQYYGADTAGNDAYLRQGLLMNMHNIAVRESNQIVESFVKGTASSATTDNAGYSIGDTVLTLASAGTGTILAGDSIVITGDASAEKYVVTSGDADVSDGGTITIAAPGLRGALSAATHAITVQDQAQRNMAMSRNAIHLVSRMLPIPEGGDAARQAGVITDSMSGMSFEMREYREYGQVRWILGHSYGYEVIKPEHLILLGD